MKVNRHAKIIELINKYHIETQEELAEYLSEKQRRGVDLHRRSGTCKGELRIRVIHNFGKR